MLPKQDSHRTASELAENAAKELEPLPEYMPNISKQDSCFAVILDGVGGRKISYECPEYGQQDVSS